MQKILVLTAILALVTTGCLVSDGGHHEHYYRGHGGYHSQTAVVVGPPVVVVRPPVVVVRPPEIIVR